MKIATNLDDVRKEMGLITDFEITNPHNSETKKVKGLWDTGATFTCISFKLSKEMNLPIVGYYTLDTPQGKFKKSSHDLGLKILPDEKEYTLKVSVFDAPPAFDIIIGLDIILQGKLAIEGDGQKVTFEFIPNKL